MKKLLILTLVAGATLLSSCSKSSNTSVVPSDNVTITGTAYGTAKIGTQTWTTQDYKGPGGSPDTLSGGLTGVSMLYTYSQANSITLPTGWRLPTASDYTKLLLSIGGTTDDTGEGTASGAIAAKLVSSYWPYAYGSDATDFSASPIGYYNSASLSLQGLNEAVAYWTSSPVPNNTMDYGFGIDNYTTNNVRATLTAYLDFYRPGDKLPLRFVKDN